MTAKLYLGHKLRELRAREALTQAALASRLGLSVSYLNQLENNQRPITVTVLVELNRVFGIDVGEFTDDDHGRLIADLREVMAEPLNEPDGKAADTPSLAEIRQIAEIAPAFARRYLALHRAWQAKRGAGAPDQQDRREADPFGTYGAVRDFFHYRNNYIDVLDKEAEALSERLGLSRQDGLTGLSHHLEQAHGVRVVLDRGDMGSGTVRRYDPTSRILTLEASLSVATLRFQAAAALARLSLRAIMTQVLDTSGLTSQEAKAVCQIALDNYAAGAMLLPYRRFLKDARSLRFDIERLMQHYQASFEQVCHRLSTLQRPSARGIPFYFVRVDHAGNITKRHSATRFQFPRFGGACPLWNIHEAFSNTGRILVNTMQMPDGVRYLAVARAIIKRGGAWRRPERHYAVGLGCELSHARDLVYADGLTLDDPASDLPVGVSCRLCLRPDCQQRAFPPAESALVIEDNARHVVPYRLG